MNIEVRTLSVLDSNADTLVVYLFEDEEQFSGDVAEIDSALGGFLGELVKTGELTGKVGQSLVFYPREAMKVRRLVIVGLGKAKGFDLDVVRRAAAVGAKQARDLKTQILATVLVNPESASVEQTARAVVEGCLLGLYTYHGQKSDKAPEALPKAMDVLVSDANDAADALRGVRVGIAFSEGAYLARDLVNLPPNICTPSYMAQRAEEMAGEAGLRFEALEEKQMRALKMGALLGVAQGSDAPPRFIILEHNADKAGELKSVVLIGKGVTFDTGGYSIKPAESMVGMKADMSGGAAVIGAMQIVAVLDLPLHVVGLVPAADNMINGHAYRPQEVVTASNGKTIEIISTDAEGRMLLADALVYAKRYNPAAVVDIATLTGACVVALGAAAAGLFSTDDTLQEALKSAAEITGERVWPLPLFPEYEKPMESDTADMKNAGGRMSGVGTAAIFLKHFVDYPAWAHVDMAGMAGMDSMGGNSERPYLPAKGATGYGARLLAEFVCQWAKR